MIPFIVYFIGFIIMCVTTFYGSFLPIDKEGEEKRWKALPLLIIGLAMMLISFVLYVLPAFQ